MSTHPSDMRQPTAAVFLFDLIQDVSVLRPLVRVLAAETDLSLTLLVSASFTRRDKAGTWHAELAELAEQTGARIARFDSPFAAVQHLQNAHGLLFSASESNLPAHATNHHVFMAAPSSFTRITVQHGHECVGFNQNREQTLAHGSAVRFAADVVCGWAPIEQMRHLCPSERSKYFELGPPLLLNRLMDRSRPDPQQQQTGLVCENLHSVRMRTTGNFQLTYLETLLAFARSQADEGRQVALRPHPGGQFILKNKISLPDNVVLANNPMFKTDLQRFAYGISAPSSVLIDMVLAGIPTAVWIDANSVIDTSGYAGLTTVTTVEDWQAFADAAVRDPQPIIDRQARFLRRAALDVAPALVRDRLLDLVRGLLAQGRPDTGDLGAGRPARILLVANGVIPTLHISFLKPLHGLEQAGRVSLRVLTEKNILEASGKGKNRDAPKGTAFALSQLEEFQPDLAVFCRYSGPDVQPMVGKLKAAGVPVVFHIDDDLLHVPKELGERKFIEHNRVERTSTVRFLIEEADVVYCSTPRLRERFVELGFGRDLYAGKIYCSREIVAEAEMRPVRTIGFMGNDKTPELLGLVPVIADILARHPDVRFELFGSMAMPEELAMFGDRALAFPPIGDYDKFVERFHQMRWDIGLCPLHQTPFNVVKADTKWVDYTSIGTAVVASRGTAYDACCADGCGWLVETAADWREALESLIDNPQARFDMVRAAQTKVREQYSLDNLTRQVLGVFDQAQQIAQGGS